MGRAMDQQNAFSKKPENPILNGVHHFWTKILSGSTEASNKRPRNYKTVDPRNTQTNKIVTHEHF